MKVILVPCSGRKRPGGKDEFEPPAWLRSQLSEDSAKSLLDARRKLATFFRLPPSLDVGFADPGSGIPVLPAWQRYDGNVYRAARFTDVWPRSRGGKVLVVSALYGLLSADDLIRAYELKMDCPGPDGSPLYTWWKTQGLGRLAAELAQSYRPTAVHDLLSGTYRKALAPWDPAQLRKRFRLTQHVFPGLGNGADHARGRLLREILLREDGDPPTESASGG